MCLTLIRGFRHAGSAAYSWQEALTPMVKGEAAMYVMGNFAVTTAAGLSDDQLIFFNSAGIPMAEEHQQIRCIFHQMPRTRQIKRSIFMALMYRKK